MVVPPLPGRDLGRVPAPLWGGPGVSDHQPAAHGIRVDDHKARARGLAAVDELGGRDGGAAPQPSSCLEGSRV